MEKIEQNSPQENITTAPMNETEEHSPLENTFELGPDVVYGGFSRSDWEVITEQLKLDQGVLFKPVNVDDMDLEDRTCIICQESFGLSHHDRCSEPVALPCGHVFGRDCIGAWRTVGVKGAAQEGVAREESRLVQTIGIDGTETFDDLLSDPRISFTEAGLSCPMCRRKFSVGMCGNDLPAIAARLRFWDDAYSKLGIIRSVEEEECRKDLWRFAAKAEAKIAVSSPDEVRSLERRAQVAAIRCVLRRVQQPHTPGQHRLLKGFFRLACYGAKNDNPDTCSGDEGENQPTISSAVDDDERPIPLWCWQLDRLDRGLDASIDSSRSEESLQQLMDEWRRQRLGLWMEALFREWREDVVRYHSEEWWNNWFDDTYVWED